MNKILIIGNGFLGNTLHTVALKNGFNADNASKSGTSLTIDIAKKESVDYALSKIKPTTVINCAAITNIDAAEKDPASALMVNAEGANNLSLACSKYEMRLIHVSTDSVFDGTNKFYKEGDIAFPINEYARSKKAGEDYVLKNSKNSIVVRTNFYGEHRDRKFLFNWVLGNLQENKSIVGFDDVIFTPLEITNLSNMLLELATSQYHGIIHLASDDAISKYQFAKTIASELGFDQGLISKGSIKDVGFIAKRPLNTSLNNSLAKKTLKTAPISLEKWLQKYKTNIA